MPERIEHPLTPDAAGVDESKYLVYSRLEIATILGTLAKAGSTVTAYFGGGNDFILTSIVAVRPEQNMVLAEYGADAAANQRALQSRKITFVAAHERIKIQFVAESVSHARYAGHDVFNMALPAALLRLQRREYFRIATPLTRPLICVIAPQRAPVRARTEVTIVDISCGGIAVIDTTETADIQSGMCFRGCRIELPDLGEVTTDILVKSVFEVTLRNGKKHKHAGCEFVGMPERERSKIQRYINKVERERKDRAGGR